MAVVIVLPVTDVPPPVCSDCENAYFGPGGVFCRVYNEMIWQESVAAECSDFDPLPWAPQSAKGA